MAGKGQQQQQGGGSDASFTPVWILLGVVGLIMLLWYEAHDQIVAVIFKIKRLEIFLIGLFKTVPALKAWDLYIRGVPVQDVNWATILAVSRVVGHFMRYPFGAIMIAMSVWIYVKNVGMKFRRVHSMLTLRNQEQQNWPQIMPIIGKELVKEDIKLGPWAMALTPMEFAQRYNLLKKDEFASRAPSNMTVALTGTIKKGEARRIFTLQLGAYWQDFEALPPHTKALAAIFAAKINRDRDGAFNLLKILSQSAAKGKLDTSSAPALLYKHKNTELVQEIVQRHAYVFTVMASLLAGAREDGVLASADFLWLKPLDRRLWYVLNNIGRQTSFPEVAGIMAHWLVEKTLEGKSLMPMVEEAVKALEVAIREVKLTKKQWGALE